MAPDETHPIPFIVGHARSGTTLLRLLLDAHSKLAIPPETHLCALFAKPYALAQLTEEIRKDILRTLRASPRWGDWQIEVAELTEALSAVKDGAPVGEALSCFWQVYASKLGKPRWGDKTPDHLRCAGAIATIFPRAKIVHLVRDPRDVVSSMSEIWFARGRSVVDLASNWANQLAAFTELEMTMRARVVTIRYEELVREPEATIKHICQFLELDFEPGQLRYFEGTAKRLAEIGDMRHSKGLIKAETRRMTLNLTHQKPTDERIGTWKSRLSEGDADAIWAIAGPAATRFGYSPQL
ncbi:sulfotransferase [Methylopila sp. M107]|uniref:sulfotransferase family protein n=1 Tax=Methylopila sp. M107 TaxID=1101190 RepID=UPI00037008F3|nr:sulfotransferase [Methylopila sp. M107]